MVTFKFHVDGLPPKKNGANSMWGNQFESERLVSLRKAALLEMKGHLPLKSGIKLTIAVHIAENNRLVGDLDTFITGVCDGLMKITSRANPVKSIWDRPENADIRPNISIAIDDDCEVMNIQAAKIEGGIDKPFYDVMLEGD
jgi:hypothetical protein